MNFIYKNLPTISAAPEEVNCKRIISHTENRMTERWKTEQRKLLTGEQPNV
jgi:hypothetical protein